MINVYDRTHFVSTSFQIYPTYQICYKIILIYAKNMFFYFVKRANKYFSLKNRVLWLLFDGSGFTGLLCSVNHPSIIFILDRVAGGLEPIPAVIVTGWHIETDNHSHSHSHLFRVNNEPNLHVFGLWEEAGVPRQKNMETQTTPQSTTHE